MNATRRARYMRRNSGDFNIRAMVMGKDEAATPGRRRLSAAARRALAEAQARRSSAPAGKTARREVDGPAGPEPTRYGDWERKGIASDF